MLVGCIAWNFGELILYFHFLMSRSRDSNVSIRNVSRDVTNAFSYAEISGFKLVFSTLHCTTLHVLGIYRSLGPTWPIGRDATDCNGNLSEKTDFSCCDFAVILVTSYK